MTNAERKRRWRELHRERLPWQEDRTDLDELLEWEGSAIKPRRSAEIIR